MKGLSRRYLIQATVAASTAAHLLSRTSALAAHAQHGGGTATPVSDMEPAATGRLDPTSIPKYQDPLLIPPVMPQAPTESRPAELGEDLDEEVLASEISDDALLDLAVFAVGLDDADVFVDGAAGGADFHGSRVHENHYHDGLRRNKSYFREFLGITRLKLSLHFFGRRGRGGRENKDLRRASGLATPNMG